MIMKLWRRNQTPPIEEITSPQETLSLPQSTTQHLGTLGIGMCSRDILTPEDRLDFERTIERNRRNRAAAEANAANIYLD